MKKKVGIVTWYNSDNYGSQLQAYALSRVVNSLGFEANMITTSRHPVVRSILDTLLYHTLLGRMYVFLKTNEQRLIFNKKYLKECYIDLRRPSFFKLHNMICGSDQIWAPNLYNPIFMLSFVPDEVNKVSYAASIGLEEIPDCLVEKYKHYIGRINHVSVREDKGKNLLKERCGIESTVVLDPTLLVNKEVWDQIKKESTIKSQYLFCYFLRKDHKYRDLVKKYAENYGLDIYGISDNPNDGEWMHLFNHRQVGPCEFIGLVEGAHTVITDSYHGTIFSLLYHKRFVLFERFDIEDKICQNSRIEQLKTYFNIGENIVRQDVIPSLFLSSCKLIDFNDFERKLSKLRIYSMNYLREALIP